MKKNRMILVLAVFMLMAFFTQPLSASTTSEGYVYSLYAAGPDETVAKITGYTGNGGNLAIPLKIEGYSVNSIEDFAFAGCTKITGVTIPDSLYNIGTDAFSGCTGMTSLSVGKNITDLGDNAFRNCTALRSINWNATFVFFDSYSKGYFAKAGSAGTGIQVTFGDNVQGVPDRLFYAEDSLSVPKVVAVSFGKNVTEVGQSAFKNCPLTAVVFSDSIVYIWRDAFAGCPLTSISFGSGLTEISDSAFAGCRMTSLTLPNKMEFIRENAFAGCPELTTVNFGASTRLCLSKNAFLNCPKLTSVTIPKGVSNVGGHTFGYCYDGNQLEKLNLTVSGYRYSAGQQYAEANGFAFVALGAKFSDVAAGAWYERYVDDLAAKAVFNGYNNHDNDGTYSFKPENSITRAEFATVLANAAGDDLSSYLGKTVFSDVSSTDWAGKYIAWAYDHGIVNGTGGGKYAPGANITRQDMAVMILRFAAYKTIALTPKEAAVTFADEGAISAYATASVAGLQQAGIITGSVLGGKAYYSPQGYATRAQAATMVSKLLKLDK